MSGVPPEENPVFNCSSLLTSSRDQDSECVRLGPTGCWGLCCSGCEKMCALCALKLIVRLTFTAASDKLAFYTSFTGRDA